MWGAWAGFTAAAEAGCPERDLSLWPSSQVIPVPETKCQMERFSGHGDGLTAQSISKQLTALQLHQLVGEKSINIYNHIRQIFPTLGSPPVLVGTAARFRWTLSSYFWVLLRVHSLIAEKSFSCLECVKANEVHSFRERERGLSVSEVGCGPQQPGNLHLPTLMVSVLLLVSASLELCLPVDHGAHICPPSGARTPKLSLLMAEHTLLSCFYLMEEKSQIWKLQGPGVSLQPSSQGSFLCYPNHYPNIHKLLGIKRYTLLSLPVIFKAHNLPVKSEWIPN